MHYNVLHTSRYITSRYITSYHITSHPHYTALKCSTYKYIRHVMMNVWIYRCVVKLYKRVKLWIWLAFSLWDGDGERERDGCIYRCLDVWSTDRCILVHLMCRCAAYIYMRMYVCVFMYKYIHCITTHYIRLHYINDIHSIHDTTYITVTTCIAFHYIAFIFINIIISIESCTHSTLHYIHPYIHIHMHRCVHMSLHVCICCSMFSTRKQ